MILASWMMENNARIYKVLSKLKKMHGHIYLSYEHEYLTGIQLALNKPLTTEQYKWFVSRVPYREANVDTAFGNSSIEINLLKAKSVQDKTIAFCIYYKHYRGTSYQAKTVEKANIKTVPVSKQLLEVFFTSPLSNYTMQNYINRINITKDWLANGANTQRFPPYYDANLDRGLSAEDQKKYYNYLRKQGWKQQYHPTTGTRWIQKK